MGFEKLLERLSRYQTNTEKIYRHDLYVDEELSPAEYWMYSDRLAYYLQEKLKDNRQPIVVYGHKHPMMLVYFLACVKSGRAYCPVDVNTPLDRIEDIIETVQSPLILTTEPLESDTPQLNLFDAKQVIENTTQQIDSNYYVQDEDLFYIIFTSGSTGKPKGVSITYHNLNQFLKWYTGYYEGKGRQVFLGHPPFSFDLSVMSLWPALYMNAPLVQIDKRHLQDFKKLFHTLQQSEATVWISTPSFAEMCLVDPSFNQELLPDVRQFVFCGEKLFATTVKKLMERFPQAEIVNTYGPTESTVMITWIPITRELLENYSNNLPVGKVKTGTTVTIDKNGEIIITGDTVAKGYYENPVMTEKNFILPEKGDRTYRTGDLGHFEGELLFCEGRIDFQIKLHGHRIELEDIDNNLLKQPAIRQAATVPSLDNEGKIKSITSYVVYTEPIENRFQTTKAIKHELAKHIQEYMIPKKIVFLSEMPLNNNGKIDKKKLKEL